MKTCTKCGGVEFYVNGRCKACANASSSAWYAANREQHKSDSAAYRVSHRVEAVPKFCPKCQKETDRKAGGQCKVCASAFTSDRIKKYDKAWKLKNPEKVISF